MSASYFDLLKYAATGQASPSMTYYDKMRASALMGGVVKTLTGIPPLSFKADGTPLISLSMKGNGSQQGTPTPDNPVMPTFCGVRTAQLFFKRISGCYISGTGEIAAAENYDVLVAKVIAGESYHVSNLSTMFLACGFYVNEPVAGSVSYNGELYRQSLSSYDTNVTIPSGCNYIAVRYRTGASNPMLNSGSTALPFEPFGYKIPISCAGQTTPVYLGQVSTVRRVKKLVLTGEESITKGAFPPSTNCYQFGFTRPADMGTDVVQTINSHFKRDAVTNGTYIGSLYNMFPEKSLLPEEATSADFKAYLAAQYANGTPVTVWYVLVTPTTGIANEPLAKIGDYADELSSEDAGVSIPTVNGQNVLTVDTELQPSEMSITYRG